MCKPCNGCECANIGYLGKREYHYCTDYIRQHHCRPYQKYQSYLESRRKYKCGEPITSLDELSNQEMVYVFGGPKHRGFVHSMQFRLLAGLIKGGHIYHAIRKEESNNG